METVTQLAGVETKSGSNARGNWTMYLFSASDGQKYQTFDKQLGPSLQQHIGGQLLRIVYEEKPNGDFVNRVVTAFEVAADGVTPSELGSTVSNGAQQQAGNNGGGWSPEKKLEVARQVAVKSPLALDLFGRLEPDNQTPPNALKVCEYLVNYMLHGPKGEPAPVPEQPIDDLNGFPF